MNSDVNDIISIKETIKNLFTSFGARSTIHGVARTTFRSRVRRIVWLLLILGGCCFAASQLFGTLEKFFMYPVTSHVALMHPLNIPFPAVTICNLNRLRKSFLPNDTLQEMTDDYSKPKMRSRNDREENFFLQRVSLEQRRAAWHSLETMLKFCTFNEERCTKDDFTQIKDGINGHCYTFNREGNADTRYTTQAGPMYGLVVDLDLELHEYLFLTSTAGFKVIVHDPDVPPFPEDGGVIVQPGLAANIAFEKTEIHRLSHPHGKCDKTSINNVKNFYKSYNYTYTENGCKKSCFQYALYDFCACCHISLPCKAKDISEAAKKRVGNESIPFCDYNNKDTSACIDRVMQLMKYDHRKCNKACPPACHETVYRTVVSSGFWPTELYLTQGNQTSKTSKSWLQNFRETNLKLHVYYASLDVTNITTKQEYDVNKVIGDCGGQLGLILGASILSGVEVLELFADVIVTYLRSVFSWFFTRKVKFSS